MSDTEVSVGSEQVTLSITRENTSFKVVRGAHTDTLQLVAVRTNEADVRVNGRLSTIPFLITGSSVAFHYAGESYTVDIPERGARKRTGHAEGSMAAPMPGVVLKILVAVGSSVIKGAPLLILEAMKMEHQILAPWDGVVTALQCKEGELVQPGIDLVTVERASAK